MVMSRWQRFGYACVNFGPPVSMRDYCLKAGIDFNRTERSARFAEIERLADLLMTDIKQVVPVLPISLVAAVIKGCGDRGLSAFEVESHVNRLIERIQAIGAPVYVTTRSRVETILGALNMLKIRRMVVENDGIFKVVPEEFDVLSYYANSIAHWTGSELDL
jgi:glycerol-3-phosphate O-acyltransferase